MRFVVPDRLFLQLTLCGLGLVAVVSCGGTGAHAVLETSVLPTQASGIGMPDAVFALPFGGTGVITTGSENYQAVVSGSTAAITGMSAGDEFFVGDSFGRINLLLNEME